MSRLAFRLAPSDSWEYRGFMFKCYRFGVECTNHPSLKNTVFAHYKLAQEALDRILDA